MERGYPAFRAASISRSRSASAYERSESVHQLSARVREVHRAWCRALDFLENRGAGVPVSNVRSAHRAAAERGDPIIMADRPGEGALLLYDGSCGFCAASVQFVLRHERAPHALRFASLQGELARDLLVRRPDLAAIDSLIWYEPASLERARPERVLVRSAAVLEVADYLGGIWRLLGRIGRLLPRSLRDGAYDLFARHRYRVFGRLDSCLLPAPAQRVRFLDLHGAGPSTWPPAAD